MNLPIPNQAFNDTEMSVDQYTTATSASSSYANTTVVRSLTAIYTHELPYIVRSKFCELLDADESWKLLGGHFMGMNDTQLALINQAYRRNSSPTDELLSKLDAANMRVTDLCNIMRQMNHNRAYDLLKPYEFSNEPRQARIIYSGSNKQINEPYISMSISEYDDNIKNKQSQRDWQQQHQQPFKVPDPIQQQPCHRSSMNQNFQQTSIINQNPTYGDTNEYQLRGQQVLAQSLVNTQQQDHQSTMTNQQVQRQQFAFSPQTLNNKLQAGNHPQTPLMTGMPIKQQQTIDVGQKVVQQACASNKKRTSISDQEVVNQLRLIMQIEYSELRQASNNFSNNDILGNGGFASVYRGKWKGTDVAIKRLKCNLMDQALNELTILNSYRIDNILPIYGISIDGPEACLVYQFMANGSLEDRLACKNQTEPLSWKQRAQIGEGIAKALFYLHTLRSKPLVHGDVKSANVLLDAQFVAKLGDFGLARQMFKQQQQLTNVSTQVLQQNGGHMNEYIDGVNATHCTVTSIHGTSVYLPPEYLRHKILSPAVDVYSYGIVLLEMATGARAYNGKRLLVDVVEEEAKSLSMGQISCKLKDPRLEHNSTSQSDLKIWLELLIKLGLSCAHKFKRKRPDMGSVLRHFAMSEWYQVQQTNASSNISSDSTQRVKNDNEFRLNNNAKKEQTRAKVEKISTNRKANTLDNNATDTKQQQSNLRDVGKQDTQITVTVDQQESLDAMIPLITELGIDVD